MVSSRICVALALGLAGSVAVLSEDARGSSISLDWTDVDGRPVVFSSEMELAGYYKTADVVESVTISKGITRPKRLVLEKNGIRMHAQFQAHDEYKSRAHVKGTVIYNYRDTYGFNIAAYNLALLLGLDIVPPSFEREIDGERGSVTVWLENIMTDRERLDQEIAPPDQSFWDRQMMRMNVFDELIANDDRNHLNILIDENWIVWLIDHTRSFRVRKELENPELFVACERDMWAALQQVSNEEIKTAVKPWLKGSELKALLTRRKALVEHFSALIESQGRDAVLFDLP